MTVRDNLSAERTAIDRAPIGFSQAQMPGPWSIVVAKSGPTNFSCWYIHDADDQRHKDAIVKAAKDWLL